MINYRIDSYHAIYQKPIYIRSSSPKYSCDQAILGSEIRRMVACYVGKIGRRWKYALVSLHRFSEE
jgi:hypothetical protein